MADSRAVIRAPEPAHLGSLGLDVHEQAGELFFRDMSAEDIHDDGVVRIRTFADVVVTGHPAFLSENALNAIAQCDIADPDTFEAEGRALHAVSVGHLA